MEGERRVYGLDVIRAYAILFVIAQHVLGLAPSMRNRPPVAGLGVLGVELFFVLSGFLIGGILIRLLHSNRFNAWRDLGHFWLNRWFRALPIYYVFLLIYCVAHGNPLKQLRLHASYIFFVQNFAWPIPPDFFGQSWSLSVEEWFYLVFPLVLFVLFAVLRRPMRGSVLIAASLFLVASLVLRVIFGPQASFDAFDQTLRKFVIFRFDGLMLGVLSAYLKYERPDIWRRMAARSGPALAFLAAMSLMLIFGTDLLVSFPWLQIVIFTVLAVAIALVMPFFAEWKLSESLLRRPTVGLAKSSYSIYLSHPIAVTGLAKFPALAHNEAIAFPLVTIGICVLGAVSYLCIEAPLMALRQKWNERFLRKRSVEAATPA